MADERWAVLLAKNTSKKCKKWLDGTLSARHQGTRTRVIVYNDAGSVLEEAHVPANAVCAGGEFTLERYLVQVDAQLSAVVPGATSLCADPTARTTSSAILRQPATSRPVSRGFLPPGRRKPIDSQWRDERPAQPPTPLGNAQRNPDGPPERPVLVDVTASHQHVQSTAGQGWAGTSCCIAQGPHAVALPPAGPPRHPPHLVPHQPHLAPVSLPPAAGTSFFTPAAQTSARCGRDAIDAAGACAPCVLGAARPPDPEAHAADPAPRRSASSVLRMMGARGAASDAAAATLALTTEHAGAAERTRVGGFGSGQVTPHAVPNYGEYVGCSMHGAHMDTGGNTCQTAPTEGIRMHSEVRPGRAAPMQREPHAFGAHMEHIGGADGGTPPEVLPSAADCTRVEPLGTGDPPRRVGGFFPPRQAPFAGPARGSGRQSIPGTHALTELAPAARLPTERQPRDIVNRPRLASLPRGPLIFPSAAECAAPGAAPYPVPGALIEYSSLSQYTDVFSGLLYEQINLQLWQLAHRLHSLLASGRAPSQLRALGIPLFPGSELVGYRQRASSSGGRSRSCGAGGGSRGGRSHLGRGTKRQHTGSDDGGNCDDDSGSAFDRPAGDYAAGEVAIGPGAAGSADPTIILTLRGAAREHSSANALDDLWILLRSSVRGDAIIDEHSQPVFVRSLWHGPSAEGRLGVAMVCGAAGGAQSDGGGHSTHMLPATSRYHALRGPNISDLLAQLSVLASLSLPRSLPALRFLLKPRSSPVAPPTRVDAPVTQLLYAAVREFGLNAEQAEVLRRVAGWFGDARSGREAALGGRAAEKEEEAVSAGSVYPSSAVTAGFVGPWNPSEDSPPVVLVHGAFGAGKSHLLAAALWMIRRVFAAGGAAAVDGAGGRGRRLGDGERGGSAGGCGGQVLLASLTNVAVDNVLQVLIEHGEGDALLRIGSARRIARSVISHSTHGRLGKAEEASVRAELHAALGRAPKGERAAIMAALAELESGGMAARARAVRRYPILGATCCATRLPVMEGLRCDVVVLDECSQMTEPASLLPIARLSASRILCVGDPCQLPPTLLARPTTAAAVASPAVPPPPHYSQHMLAAPSAAAPHQHLHATHDLSLTLFERLARGGVAPVLLRAQYRCHPQIARVASSLFYQGRLVDGLGDAAASARAPLLRDLPTLGFSQVSGVEQAAGNGSMTNRAEAVRCLHVIKSLLTSGLPPSAIGVICLYRAQAELLGIMLSGEGGSGGGASKRDAGVGMSYGGVPMASPTKDVCGWDSTGDVAHGAPHGRVCQDEEMREVTVSTVDAFQGAEREVIIVSTCRTQSLGFVASPRRLNVTLTRARRHLLIVGSAPALMSDPRWATILDAAGSIPEECTRGEPMQPTRALDDLAREADSDGRRTGSAPDEPGTTGADVGGEGVNGLAQGHKRTLELTPSVSSARSKPAFDILAIFDETDSESGDVVGGLGATSDGNLAAGGDEECGVDGIEGDASVSGVHDRDQSVGAWIGGTQPLLDDTRPCDENVSDTDPLQGALKYRGVAEGIHTGFDAAGRLVVGDKVAYRAGDGSLTAVSVLALHNDDPEGGAYATVQLPDGRERHTEITRLLLVEERAEAMGAGDAQMLLSPGWQSTELGNAASDEGGCVQSKHT